MRKQYSKYYLSLMLMSGICIILGILVLLEQEWPELSAVVFMIAFVSWLAGAMAPDHEKYVK
jgi:hypothetical protein